MCPDPTLDPRTFLRAFEKAVSEYIQIILQALLDCWCSAWLPSCPEPTDDSRVPLAVVKIRKKDCKILSVCNWTVLRPFAVTVPMFQYWFSWIHPFFQLQPDRSQSERLCCDGIKIPEAQPPEEERPLPPPPGGEIPIGRPGRSPRAEIGDPPSLSASFFQFGQTGEGAEKIGMGLLKRVQRNPPPLSVDDLTIALLTSGPPLNLNTPGVTESPHFKLLEVIIGTFFSSLDVNLLQAFGGPGAQKITPQSIKESHDLLGLRSELQELREKVKVQEVQVKDLTQRLKKGKFR